MPAPTAVAVRDVEPKAIVVIREELEKRSHDLLTVLPPGMDAERFRRVALLAISKNEKLLRCTPGSLIAAIIEAAEVGLEPTGGVGGAHLVPFRQKDGPDRAQLIYDYRGIQHLIREGGGGEVKTVLVYDGDDFTVHEGTNPRIEHLPHYETTDPVSITYVYAWPLDFPSKFEVMTKSQIDGIRARSRASNVGPWVTDYGAMARKTVLKRIGAWLPLKPSARAAIDRDTEREVEATIVEAPLVTRANRVRERLAARREPVSPAENAPGAEEKPETDASALPAASASQQPKNESVAVCGVTNPTSPGPENDCAEPTGHEGPHKSLDGGLVWPRQER